MRKIDEYESNERLAEEELVNYYLGVETKHKELNFANLNESQEQHTTIEK